MSINGSIETREITVGDTTSLNSGVSPVNSFVTGRLHIVFTGDVLYGSPTPDTPLTESLDVLPGTYALSFSDSSHAMAGGSVAVKAGDDLTRTAMYIRLVDSSDKGIAGGVATAWLPNPAPPAARTWQEIGTTDAAGAFVHLHDGFIDDHTSVRIAASRHGSGKLVQDATINSFYDFQTSVGTVTLADHAGNPLAGGVLSAWTNGASQFIGSTDPTGSILFEALNGAYEYEMVYNHTLQRIKDANAHTAPVAFQTGQFTVNFTGDASWGPGSLYPYEGPQEVLPGDYDVNLRRSGWWGVNRTITVGSGDDITKTGVMARITDSGGMPIEGATARINLSGWPSLGTTDSHGVTAELLDGIVTGGRTVRMSYNGTTSDETHDLSADSFYDFETLEATIHVQESDGDPIAGTSVRQNSSGWPEIGITDSSGDVHVELFGSYQRSYRVAHNGTTSTLSHAFTPGDQTLTFETMDARIRVRSSAKTPIAGLDVRQNSSGWPIVGTTDASGEVHMELFAGYERSYRVTYNGTTATKKKTFTPNKHTLTFSTLDATIRFVDSAGQPFNGVDVRQNSSGWPVVGTTDSAGEVHFEAFAGYKRSYRITHNGTTDTKTKTFRANTATKPNRQTLKFQTMDATVLLVDSQNAPIPAVDVRQNSSGWPVIGTTAADGTVQFEIFRGNQRSYRITYHGTTETKSKNFRVATATNPYRSVLTFKAIGAIITVLDGDGNGIADLEVRQNSSGWPIVGVTNTNGRLRYDVLRGYERSYRVTNNGETQTEAKAFMVRDRRLTFTFATPTPPSD